LFLFVSSPSATGAPEAGCMVSFFNRALLGRQMKQTKALAFLASSA
jgi:hypothetical protein